MESSGVEGDGIFLGCITELKNAGLKFRNDMETGPGGRQIRSRILTGIRLSCLNPRAPVEDAGGPDGVAGVVCQVARASRELRRRSAGE